MQGNRGVVWAASGSAGGWPPRNAAFNRFKQLIEAEWLEQHQIDPCLAARRYRGWARRIPAQAWEDAQVAPEHMRTHERQMARAEALECCRLWFTRALKNKERPAGISIHISADPRFRLGVDAEFRA